MNKLKHKKGGSLISSFLLIIHNTAQKNIYLGNSHTRICRCHQKGTQLIYEKIGECTIKK